MKVDSAQRLGNESLPKLFLAMAIPSVLAQLINVLYNIVDRIYISRIPEVGALALTGIGVTFPIIMIITAFSAFTGQGGAPLASINLGQKNLKKSEEIIGSSIFLLSIFSIVLTVFFQLFKTPLLYAFGASDSIINYSLDYIGIYLFGTPFVMFSLGLNNFISGQGKAKTAMTSVLIGASLNIILDPIFIFYFKLGVKGASIATIISQGCSCIWILSFLFSEKNIIKIKKEFIKFNKEIIKTITSLGISPFVMQSTESLVLLTLNSNLQKYGGDLYVGSMSILISIIQLIMVPTDGISQGVQPIISYNYGARNFKRVSSAFKGLLFTCLTLTLIMGGVAIIHPRVYISLFAPSKDLLLLTEKIMPFFFIGMCIFGIQQAIQGTFLALGQAKVSVFIALLRKVILLVPLAIILPHFFGVYGIYFAEPIADTCSVIVASFIFRHVFKKLLS